MSPVSEKLIAWNRLQALRADTRHRKILNLYRRGIPQVKIAKRLGYSEGWVSQVLKRARERGVLE